MTIEKGSITRGAQALARLNTQGFNISTAPTDKDYSKDPFQDTYTFLIYTTSRGFESL